MTDLHYKPTFESWKCVLSTYKYTHSLSQSAARDMLVAALCAVVVGFGYRLLRSSTAEVKCSTAGHSHAEHQLHAPAFATTGHTAPVLATLSFHKRALAASP